MDQLLLDHIVKLEVKLIILLLFGYSNKGHDGFLGNSVLGEWCNLGADTNNSNLKIIMLKLDCGIIKLKVLPKLDYNFVD